MQLDRLNPVALVSGAASGIGAACARDIARYADGGLILADGDADALDAAADALERPPERVSTLAIDTSDPDRWAQATKFITEHYGRLDWAVLTAPPAAAENDLVQWGPPADIDSVALGLRAVLPLMRYNAQGGAIVVIARATPALTSLLRDVAREALRHAIRINAIAVDGGDDAAWRDAPLFQDLVLTRGSQRAALDAIAGLPAPLVRYAGARNDVGRLAMLLLSDASPITGATLVVDGGYAI